MRIPWAAPIASDPDKLQLRPSWTPRRDVLGERIYELMHQPVLVENFGDLDDWTTVDSGSNVSLSSGVVSINGNGTPNANGIWLTDGIAKAEGVFEFKVLGTVNALADYLGLSAVAGLQATAAGAVFTRDAAYALWARAYFGTLLGGCGQVTNGQWITLRIYLGKNLAGNVLRLTLTAEGGSGNDGFEKETIIAAGRLTFDALPATLYPMFQRVANASGEPDQIKEVRWKSGYPTDGPTLTYVADAGSGKLFNGLVFANLAAVGSWATTNVTFAYSFDDGTPSYSAEKTLAQLNALDALTTNKRYIRLRITVNSDGATQQYAGELNADDGTAAVEAHTANEVLTTAAVSPGNYIPISAASDVRWNVLYGLSQRGTLGAPPSGNSQGRLFFELLHNTIRDSGLLNAVLVSGTAADHVDFPRFHLGEPTANIYPTRLNQAPRIFLTPGDVVTLPSNNRSNVANATAEVDIVSLVRNNSEYLNALEFADSMARYLAGPNCGGYWKSGSWTSGTMSISNIQVRQEKPQPMPNNCMSYRLNISADLRQVGY